MGIRFNCPNGHKLNVKEFLAGKRGVCPQCGAKFIIPELDESPQPVGVGQSQSVEIATSPAANHPSSSFAGSPSVIIPVTDIEIGSPEVQLQTDVLPASIVPVPPPIVAGPVGVSPEAASPSPRQRSRRNQLVISLSLLVLVVLLAGILIWVLKRQTNQPPVEKTTAVAREEFHQEFAMIGSRFPTGSHAHAGVIKT
jgi:hypothetical protein